jgi:hypothetical protein
VAVAKKTSVLGVSTKRGEKMKRGKGWRLVKGELAFKATLIRRFNVGSESVAMFRVLPMPNGEENSD